MTIFIANANGKIGQEVVKALIAKGETVRIGVRDVAKAKAEFPGAEVVAIDLARPETMAAGVTGAKAVFSAFPGEYLPQADAVLAALAKAAGVKRYVKLSVVGADQNEAGEHRQAEKAIEASGLEWTHLRPTFFMQNYSVASAAEIKAKRTFTEASGDGKTAFIDARDIAAVAVKALTEPGHNGKAYTLTGSQALDRKQVASLIGEAIGAPVSYVAIDDAALMAALAGASDYHRTLYSTLYGYVRAGYTAGTVDTVETLLGRKPLSFAQFARDHAAVWK
jgi:uncharacterized protein YbjT (DUF2867 family)